MSELSYQPQQRQQLGESSFPDANLFRFAPKRKQNFSPNRLSFFFLFEVGQRQKPRQINLREKRKKKKRKRLRRVERGLRAAFGG